MNDVSGAKAQMDPAEVVKTFFDTLNTSGPEAAAGYLADSYAAETPPFPPRSKEQWVGNQKMFTSAFPDLHEEFEIQSVDGNVVRGINRITGTHTGDFDLSEVGIGVIPATGKSATIVVSVTHVVEDSKIVSTRGKPVDNMGISSVLTQLGIEMP